MKVMTNFQLTPLNEIILQVVQVNCTFENKIKTFLGKMFYFRVK